jgi:glyoxylase-like metal-dependent hydrolase (beta-lactamase superfamily II)
MAISVDRVVLHPQYGSNCYIVRASEDAALAAVVDPGGDPAPLLERLAELESDVAGILVTHADIDHIEGVAALAEATGAEVWAPAGEADLLRSGRTRGGMEVTPHDPEHSVGDGDVIRVAGIDFDVIGIPGHSAGHVAFETGGSLFSGDLLFAGSVGRVDFPGGNWDELINSIRRLAERYGPGETVFSGHGGPTTIGRELETNPFLGELR